jgi:hypothetical protein
MALVRKLDKNTQKRESKHAETECTYSVVFHDSGEKYLQIDTYGSKERQELGAKSQAIRFSPEAIEELKIILQREFS